MVQAYRCPWYTVSDLMAHWRRYYFAMTAAERNIKPFVIDRKNFLFPNTPKGATASAVTFRIIQTAIANNLDPYTYLTYIFTEAPKMVSVK